MSERDERLSYLFQRYADNACTREELDELIGRVGSDDEDAIHDWMDGYYAQLRPGENAERVDWERMYSYILSQPARGTVRKLIRRRWWAAAVLVLLAGIGSWWFFRFGEERRPDRPSVAAVSSPDIAPGAFKALLQLGDGRRVVLDSVATGKVAQQGAASITGGAGGLVYTEDRSKRGELLYNTLSTARGETYSFTMTDGTRVWLDAASSIRFPAAFRGNERAVELLAGQAYFEVAAGAGKPFSVRQGKALIQVLGTHFNVNAHGDEDVLKVTLLEGSVRVNEETTKQAVVLKPGQQARVGGQKVVVAANIDVDQVVAWKNGLFNFKNTDLKTMMKELARWYAIDVSYEGGTPAIAITGKAPRSIDLMTMLKLLQLSEVRYRIEGRRLIITE